MVFGQKWWVGVSVTEGLSSSTCLFPQAASLDLVVSPGTPSRRYPKHSSTRGRVKRHVYFARCRVKDPLATRITSAYRFNLG